MGLGTSTFSSIFTTENNSDNNTMDIKEHGIPEIKDLDEISRKRKEKLKSQSGKKTQKIFKEKAKIARTTEKAKYDLKILNNNIKAKKYNNEQYNKGLRTKSLFILNENEPDKIVITDFPEFFQSVQFPELFDNEYWIGFDAHGDNYIDPSFDLNHPSLKIYNIDEPTRTLFVKINVWLKPDAFDYWFRHEIRPNRIYLSDYDGLKVYDFELNLIFELKRTAKDIENVDVYEFEIDDYDWDSMKVWSANQMKIIKENGEISYPFNNEIKKNIKIS